MQELLIYTYAYTYIYVLVTNIIKEKGAINLRIEAMGMSKGGYLRGARGRKGRGSDIILLTLKTFQNKQTESSIKLFLGKGKGVLSIKSITTEFNSSIYDTYENNETHYYTHLVYG